MFSFPMRAAYLVSMLLLLLCPWATAQTTSCDLYFTTQDQLDSYVASGVCITARSLTIQGRVEGGHPGGVVDLSALRSLTEVTGDVYIHMGMIHNIEGLENLRTIGGNLTISGATNLQDLSINIGPSNAFHGLVTVGGSLHIRDNPSLTNISGFFRLRHAGYIEITRNPKLVNLMGMTALATAGRLDINACPALRTINGFTNLHTLTGGTGVTGDLFINSNPVLETIAGFVSLETVDRMVVDDNGLQNLDGFNALRRVQNLSISNNATLRSIKGFNGRLTATTSPGVHIARNAKLETISGFNDLDAAAVMITLNPLLREISGFADGRVASTLNVINNAGLQTISGFCNATGAPQTLQVTQHPLLDSISGFTGPTAPQWIGVENNPALRTLRHGFAFTDYATLNTLKLLNNAALASCSVPWVCQYLSRRGYSEIDGNAASCTPTSIRQACTPLSTRPGEAKEGGPYPNPVRDVLHLPAQAAFQVCDLTGRVLRTGVGGQVSLTDLPSGVYVVHTGTQEKSIFRFVKE